MAELVVKIDAVAAIRESRKEQHPDPVAAAVLADLAGAEGIAAHLREDRRHIQDRDVRMLRKIIQHNFILEMAQTSEMVGIALDIRPDLVILVPEKRRELTIKGGMDLVVHKNDILETVQTLQNADISVSILIDPDTDQIKLAHQMNASMIEIFAGKFCRASTSRKKERAFSEIVYASKLAHKLKLGINVGHGLCYDTIKALKAVNQIDTFIVGHSITSKAVLTGMETAVKEMISLIRQP
jgi:pyridoxine 5-phosphate synthase